MAMPGESDSSSRRILACVQVPILALKLGLQTPRADSIRIWEGPVQVALFMCRAGGQGWSVEGIVRVIGDLKR